MPTISYKDHSFSLEANETVLDCLLREGQSVSYSCRTGVCQSCLMKAAQGTPSAEAQAGLRDTLKLQGYFMACKWKPADNVTVCGAEDLTFQATLVGKELLSETVLKVLLQSNSPFSYQSGQYLTLIRPDGLARSYSIASLPRESMIELHVRIIPNGQMSSWLLDEAQPGTPLTFRGPFGTCFYLPDRPEQPLLLVGTGTGLAPLYGIARDALTQNHKGPIWLFHGALTGKGLYLVNQLRELAARFPQFQYQPTLLHEDEQLEYPVLTGSLDTIVMSQFPQLKSMRAFLCGDPDIVNRLRKKFFLAGLSLRDIYADAFVPSSPT
ncbi:MAG: 2Fe-2S iron-sulfur cluster binding domain-containing protein [Acidobacteria bacterium]|nr:2Fe-2S iron-sulfur cluster binding domain-containing protein [Acidobacteriota bacterium]